MIQLDSLTGFTSQLREKTDANIAEDMALLSAGILDKVSFENGYKQMEHPVEVQVRDRDGNLKQIRRSHNLRTNIGASCQAIRMCQGNALNAAIYVGITASSTTPSSSDTTLVGELTTNGLGRASAVFAQTAPATTASLSQQGTLTLTITYTYTGSSAQSINKLGIFDASSSGNMWFETAITTATVNANGDSVTIIWTLNF